MERPRKTLAQMQAESVANEGGVVWACPECGCKDLRVTNTWNASSGNKKRLRKCRNCNYPMGTCEIPVPDGFKLQVVPESA